MSGNVGISRERLKSGLQYCRKCYQKGTSKIQGLFKCKNCNISENADRNAAFNIAYRALGYISKVGVTVGLPNTRTLASIGMQ
ncbi:MAG: zinc ribbon domain-containing protein [Candidatus Nitrosopolaris sp.]